MANIYIHWGNWGEIDYKVGSGQWVNVYHNVNPGEYITVSNVTVGDTIDIDWAVHPFDLPTGGNRQECLLIAESQGGPSVGDTTTIAANQNYFPYLDADECNVTINPGFVGANGKVMYDPGDGAVQISASTTVKVPTEYQIELSVTDLSPGYTFDEWYVTAQGESQPVYTSSNTTITYAVTRDVTVTPYLVAPTLCSVEIETDGVGNHGEIYVGGTRYTSDTTINVAQGATIALVVSNLATNYRFRHWLITYPEQGTYDDSDTNASTTYTVTEHCVIRPVLYDPVMITYTVSPAGTGTLSNGGAGATTLTQQVPYNTAITVGTGSDANKITANGVTTTATPAQYCTFLNWSGTVSQVTANTTITALFQNNGRVLTVEGSPYARITVTIPSMSITHVVSSGDTWTQTMANNTQVQLFADQFAQGYEIDVWDVKFTSDDTPVTSSGNNPFELTVDGDYTASIVMTTDAVYDLGDRICGVPINVDTGIAATSLGTRVSGYLPYDLTVSVSNSKVHVSGTPYPTAYSNQIIYNINGNPDYNRVRIRVTSIPGYKYVLEYDADGGANAPSSSTYLDTTRNSVSWQFNIPNQEPTKIGQTFVGWSDGSGTIYKYGTAHDTYTIVREQNEYYVKRALVAVWTPRVIEVILYTNNQYSNTILPQLNKSSLEAVSGTQTVTIGGSTLTLKNLE